MQLITVKRKDEKTKYFAMDKRTATAKLKDLVYQMERDSNLVEVTMQPLADFAQGHFIGRLQEC